MCTDYCCINYADYITAATAIAAVILSLYQYNLYKERERSKVFSKLNELYLNNKDVQFVVRYLNNIIQDIPNNHQTELFLRFFEELSVYLKSNSIEPEIVEKLFGYYLFEVFTSAKGQKLLKACNYEVSEWKYLEEFKEMMSDVDPKWLKTLNKNFSIWS